jgi:hypothetical protein
LHHRGCPRSPILGPGRARFEASKSCGQRPSENAVKTKIWIAVSVYLLVAIVKKRLDLPGSLYTLLQVLSVTLFEKMPISQALQQTNYTNPNPIPPRQLILFDF